MIPHLVTAFDVDPLIRPTFQLVSHLFLAYSISFPFQLFIPFWFGLSQHKLPLRVMVIPGLLSGRRQHRYLNHCLEIGLR